MQKFDLEEQERIDRLRYFLRDWGKYVVALVIVLATVYASDVTWSWYKNKDALKIAAIYEDFIAAVNLSKVKTVYMLAEQMENNYPNAEYTAMASMWAAKIAKLNNNPDDAVKYLQFTINNAKDTRLVDIARLRLADVYIDLRKFSLALMLLLEPHDKAFDALYYTERGDLHLANGDINKARAAYKEALQIVSDDPATSQGIQMRLDMLGGN